METLAVGDRFIAAPLYTQAIAELLGGDFGPIRTIEWSGEKTAQHATQQVMETQGPNAVPPPEELLAAVPGAQALCLHFAPVGEKVLAAADALRLVAVARTGLENVDVRAATARGVGVVPVYGRNAGAVAELQIGLMLTEARNIARADASVKAGGWRKEFPGARIEIAGRTVGMVGFGHVGAQFATRLAGFGCELLAYDPYAGDELLSAHGVTRAPTLEDVFRRADFVVVQARHSAETDRFIGAAQLALMSPDAYLINVSRSRVVDTAALHTALAEGRIAGAGLDVYDEEPLPSDSPWRTLDNVTLTTHFGGDTEETGRTSTRLVAQILAEYAETGRVRAAVNAEALGWV
ncbi:NAD(P)-dependent oxidoreductase [Actinomycetes bacterium KLBMP 9797]